MDAERARNWCMATFGLSALLALAGDVLAIDGRSGWACAPW
jgi:hypothetical protein